MEHALYHAGYSPILRESRDGEAVYAVLTQEPVISKQ